MQKLAFGQIRLWVESTTDEQIEQALNSFEQLLTAVLHDDGTASEAAA